MTYFDTKLSMFGLAPSAMEGGPKAPKIGERAIGAQRAPQPSAGARRRDTECPELLVLKKCKNIIILDSDLLQMVSRKEINIFNSLQIYMGKFYKKFKDCEDEEQLLTNDSPNIDVQKDY